MKSYLSLIPIAARARRRQNRMTILCIVLSVLLVTVIFSVTDGFLRAERAELLQKHGSWHLRVADPTEETAQAIAARMDVTLTGCAARFNQKADRPVTVGGKKAALMGADEAYLTGLTESLTEGRCPQADDEALLSPNAKLALGVSLGDSVTLMMPGGAYVFTVCGFGSDDRSAYSYQTYLVQAVLTRHAFAAILAENGYAAEQEGFYIRFANAKAAAGVALTMQEEYGLAAGSVTENSAVMGMSGISGSASWSSLYGIAAALFILVLLAGVLMIAGSLNSSVAQRTQFFGMLRCLGASRRQIVRFVRLEALAWCRTAVPLGLALGTGIAWALSALLRFGIGGEFARLPVVMFSPLGLLSGALVGMGTVLLAASAPARRAAAVSPITAVSGNAQKESAGKIPFAGQGLGIDVALGIRYAASPAKNWVLMTMSLALCIVLALCFAVGLDFARALLPVMRPWQPDVVLNGYGNALELGTNAPQAAKEIPGVRLAYGSAVLEDVHAASRQLGEVEVRLISYSDALMELMGENARAEDLEAVLAGEAAATVDSRDNPLRVGDVIAINGREIPIVCGFSSSLWPESYSVIVSDAAFARLTGKTGYSLIGVQFSEHVKEETVLAVAALAEGDVIFTDLREDNAQSRATYRATELVLCSFLLVLALIALFHMANSLSLGVTARLRQLGAMRALGMEEKQLVRMVASEALTYALSGLAAGLLLGLPISRALHVRLVTRYFGVAWQAPVSLITVAAALCLLSAALAVREPVRRIRSLSIAETIAEL